MIPGVKQKFYEGVVNENEEMLIDFYARNEMRINNTYFSHKEQHKVTFNNTRMQTSMIDFIITNRAILPTQVLDVRALTSANLGTDHNLILSKLRMKQPRKVKKLPHYSERYNIESFIHESCQELYKTRLHEKLETQETSNCNVEEHWNAIKDSIKKGAEEAIGT